MPYYKRDLNLPAKEALLNEVVEVVIENEFLRVRISAKGAEMQSIEQKGAGWTDASSEIIAAGEAGPADVEGGADAADTQAGLERLWCADPVVWGRHAPILFPLIGRLREGCYLLGGKRFDAPTHGFCRDRVFAVERLSPTAVRFTTVDDAQTREVYPFSFSFSVECALEGSAIVKTHRVENRGEGAMPFEVGGHEAYAVRLLPGERMADYFVRFEGLDCLEAFGMDERGILSLPKERIELDAGCLRRTPEQLGLDTVVLEDVPGRKVTLGCDKSDHEVTVEFPDFPYLGIWTAQGKGEPRYLCIEPWSALPDGHFASREFSEKPGVRTLASGEVAELTYRMEFR